MSHFTVLLPPRCVCVCCVAESAMAGAVPLFPATLTECHQRIAKILDENARLHAALQETHSAYQYLDARCVELATQKAAADDRVHYAMANVASMSTRIAELNEVYVTFRARVQPALDRLAALEAAANRTKREVSAAAGDAYLTLCAGYDLGAILLAGVAPAPPPSSVLFGALWGNVGAVESLSSNDHEAGAARTPTVADLAAAVDAADAKEDIHGSEAEAHANARRHQQAWADALATITEERSN